MAKLLSAARKAKEVLSTNSEAGVHVITLLHGQDYATTVNPTTRPHQMTCD
jgi:molecular chaperone DnaK (HSP70)